MKESPLAWAELHRTDWEVSNPAINDVPSERIATPTLILQSVDDPRELEGGREMARRIPHNDYFGLPGGHLLLRRQPEIRTESLSSSLSTGSGRGERSSPPRRRRWGDVSPEAEGGAARPNARRKEADGAEHQGSGDRVS